MNTDFLAAMRRATMATRTGSASDATRIIQDAMASRPGGADGPSGPRPRRPLREVVKALRRGKPYVELPGTGAVNRRRCPTAHAFRRARLPVRRGAAATSSMSLSRQSMA